MISSGNSVICDYLDLTYSPDAHIFGSDFHMGTIEKWLLSVQATCEKRDSKSALYRLGDRGRVKMDSNSTFKRVSASGAALAHLRKHSIFEEYLSELASEPHRVTRLDAALDVPQDGADTIAELKKRFSNGHAALGRKALKVNYITSVRDDGRESGSCYLGHRQRARQTARVYDKQLEAFEKRKELLPPTTRYEVTAKGERDRPSPTLRDAAEPTSIFWHIASPTLLQAPSGIKPWVPGDGDSWKVKRPELLPAEVVERKLSYNPDLDAIFEIASQDGSGGLKRALRLIATKYHIDL